MPTLVAATRPARRGRLVVQAAADKSSVAVQAEPVAVIRPAQPAKLVVLPLTDKSSVVVLQAVRAAVIRPAHRARLVVPALKDKSSVVAQAVHVAATLPAAPSRSVAEQVRSHFVQPEARLVAGTPLADGQKPVAGAQFAAGKTRFVGLDAAKYRDPDPAVRGMGCVARLHGAILLAVSRGWLASAY
jgi:hypothetical protein